MKVTIEVSPEEAARLLQALAEQSGESKQGQNSRVNVGEQVNAVLKRGQDDAGKK